MTLKVQSKSLIFLFLILTSLHALAVDSPPLEAEPKVPEKSGSLEKKFIDSNIAISNWLDRVAEKIDLFLVGKKTTTRKNETSVRVQSSSFISEGRPVINSFSIGFNPRFPNLEEFLQIKFTQNEDRNATRTAVSNSSNVNQTEKNYSTSSNLFQHLGAVQTTFQPRIALGNPLKISHSLNFESALHFNKKTSILNPKLELFADADRGVGFYDAFNFQFILSPIYNLTLINDGEYLDKVHSYTVNNGFAIGQVINDRVNFAYSLVFTSRNQPSYHLENYVVAFAWNEQYYKKILDLQFIPQINFEKMNGYKGSAGVTFNISVNF